MIYLQGEKQLQRKLKEAPKLARKGAIKGTRAGAKIITSKAKDNAPTGETKDLKKNIKTRAMKRSTIAVGCRSTIYFKPEDGQPYASFVVLGRKNRDGTKQPENRFMKQAGETAGPKAGTVCCEVMASEIVKAMSK